MDSMTNPTSPSQRRDWGSHHSRADNSFLNLPLALDLIPGPRGRGFQMELLAEAVAVLVARHDALRTTFETSEGGLVQVTHALDDGAAPMLEVFDDDVGEVDQWLTAQAGTSLDLTKTAPAAFHLLRTSEGAGTLLMMLHHIIGDHLSLELMAKDLSQIIDALATGASPDLPPITISFPQSVGQWAAKWESGQMDRSIDFWCEQLRDAPEETPVPKLGTAQPEATDHQVRLSGLQSQSLRNTAAAGRTTNFVVALTAFGEALSSLTGATDQIFACGFANRLTPSAQRSVGRYVSGMPLRLAVKPGISLPERLQAHHRVAMSSYVHARNVSLDAFLESGRLARPTSPTPYANVAFQLVGEPWHSTGTEVGEMRPRGVGTLTSKRDLHVTLVQEHDTFLLSVVHRPGEIPSERVDELQLRFQDNLARLADAVRADG